MKKEIYNVGIMAIVSLVFGTINLIVLKYFDFIKFDAWSWFYGFSVAYVYQWFKKK